MEKLESLNLEKFRLNAAEMKRTFGGRQNPTDGDTGDCHGTGCSRQTSEGIIDWEDIECNETNYPGDPCPPAS